MTTGQVDIDQVKQAIRQVRNLRRVILCRPEDEDAIADAVNKQGIGGLVTVVPTRYLPVGEAYVVDGSQMPGDGDPREWGVRLPDGRWVQHPPFGPVQVDDAPLLMVDPPRPWWRRLLDWLGI